MEATLQVWLFDLTKKEITAKQIVQVLSADQRLYTGNIDLGTSVVPVSPPFKCSCLVLICRMSLQS